VILILWHQILNRSIRFVTARSVPNEQGAS
jgi:hypothetical protein